MKQGQESSCVEFSSSEFEFVSDFDIRISDFTY